MSPGFEFKKIEELYKSNISESIDYGQSKVKYYCMNCGYEHREIACPKCGSNEKGRIIIQIIVILSIPTTF
jgi:rubrerythrin